jgi:hypothetical protein
MEPQITSKVATVTVAAVPLEGLSEIVCRSCDAPLDVSQPDPNLPDRLLATCPDCLAWYLVETTGDQGMAWVASLESLVGMTRPRDLRQASP